MTEDVKSVCVPYVWEFLERSLLQLSAMFLVCAI